MFEKILMLIGILIVIFGALSPIFNILFKVIIAIIELFVKGTFIIISLPFKILSNLFTTKKKKP